MRLKNFTIWRLNCTSWTGCSWRGREKEKLLWSPWETAIIQGWAGREKRRLTHKHTTKRMTCMGQGEKCEERLRVSVIVVFLVGPPVRRWHLTWKSLYNEIMNLTDRLSSLSDPPPEQTPPQKKLTLSLPKMINFKFPLQPHQKYYITQDEELGFS